jgi:hypothetical protein
VCHLLSWSILGGNQEICFLNCLVGCTSEFKGLTMCNPSSKLEWLNSSHGMRIVFLARTIPHPQGYAPHPSWVVLQISSAIEKAK